MYDWVGAPELRMSGLLPRVSSPLIGYRFWFADIQSSEGWFRLRGPLRGQYGSPWMSPVMNAECESGHPAPVRTCRCGIYAYRSVAEAMRRGGKDFQRLSLQTEEIYVVRVFGAVALSGLIVEHEYGWRAERAVMEWLEIPRIVGGRSSRLDRGRRIPRFTDPLGPPDELSIATVWAEPVTALAEWLATALGHMFPEVPIRGG